MGRPPKNSSSFIRKNKRREPIGTREKQVGVDFLQQVLSFFNVFFLIAGIGVLGVGLWTVVDKHHYASILVSTTYAVAAYLLVAAGCLVIIACIIGFIGICKLRQGWMLAYIFLLLLIFLLEAAAGVLSYLYADQMKSDLVSRLKEIVVHEYGSNNTLTTSLDSLQNSLGCCGSVLFEDWSESSWGGDPAITAKKLGSYVPVPDSCCKNVTSACGFMSHPSNIYYDGCAETFAAFLREHLYIIGGVGIGVCAVQIFGAILSCCLVSKMSKPKERYSYSRSS